MAVPAVKEAIFKQMPAMRFLIKVSDLQPHLSNLTLWNLVHIGLAKGDGIAEIDRQLAMMKKSR